MRIVILGLFGIWCLGFGASAWAQGQAGMDIAVLKAGVGARPLGMGGAFTSVADNADAPYWNPAGLGMLDRNEITAMQTRLSTDADHYYVSYIRPAFGGTLGLSWIQVGLGTITQTTTPDANNEVQNLSIFSYFSNAYMLSYGKEFNPHFAFGLTVKYLTSDMYQIAGGQAEGYSITPGILINFGKRGEPEEKDNKEAPKLPDISPYLRERRIAGPSFPVKEEITEPTPIKVIKSAKPKKSFIDGLALGIKCDELYNWQKWGTGTVEQVPAKLRIGLSYKSPNPGLFAVDVSQIMKAGYAPELSAGYEWSTKDGLSLRVGYNDGGLSAGAGFISGHTRLDYAYVTQRDLTRDNVHRIALTGIW